MLMLMLMPMLMLRSLLLRQDDAQASSTYVTGIPVLARVGMVELRALRRLPPRRPGARWPQLS